jgi:magnesium transporter
MPNENKNSRNIQIAVIDNPRTANEKITWINVVDAGKKEIEYLRKKYGFQLSHLRASSASVFSQRPALYRGDNYLFLILHFPIYQNDQIMASEVDFFIGHSFLITLHHGNLKPLTEFFNLCKKDGESLITYELESSAVLLYEILQKLMIGCYPLLDKNSIAINKVEEMIFSQNQRQAVTKILFLRQNIINFRKIMQSHRTIMTKLEELKSSLVPPNYLKKYYRELVDHAKTIWDVLENQKEVISVLNSTNESLQNYRLSDIMRTLTIFSVIIFSLSLVTTIFSMRAIDLPLVRSHGGFVAILGIMVFVGMAVIIFFKTKKWF